MTGAVEAQASQTQFSGVHAALTGLAADDHLQYALLAGRALGQTLIGGTAVSEELGLRGSTDAALGAIRVFSPIIIDDTSASPLQFPIDRTASFSVAAFNGGMMRDAGVLNYSNAFFIWGLMVETRTFEAAVDPGFAAFTLFNALPRIVNDGNFDLVQAFILNAGVVHERQTAGTSTTNIAIGLSFAAQARATISGAVMTYTTGMTAVQCSPTFGSVAGSTINFGTIRGLHCVAPGVGIFQPSAGVENMTAYIGVDVNAINFGGNVTKVALRSAILAATNARFIQNISTAESDFGAGHAHWNDGAASKYGNTVAAPDAMIFWDPAASALRFSPFFGTGGNPLDLVMTAADEVIFGGTGLGDIGIGFDVNAIVFGGTLPTPNSNNWFVQFAGPNLRQVQIGGEYSDVLWTASGSIDVNGQTVSDLQAFKINSPAVLLSGGTIDDISNLFVSAMPSFGATRTQALRVLGRGRIDGHINQGSQEPAQILANSNNFQLAANNGQRGIALLDSDDNYNITGIDSSFGRGQAGDLIKLINVGAFNLTLTHEDTASLAANRFLRANALDLVLAPGDAVEIWKDDTATDRWRILETIATGAGLLSGPWAFSTATGAADPGAGRLRYDNATPASVTNVYIDQLTDNGGDAQNILSALASGDQLYIQDQRDAANFLVFDITGVTDQTGWFTIAGTVNASGGLPANNRVLTVSARFA